MGSLFISDTLCLPLQVLQEVQARVQRQLLRGPNEGRGEEEVFLQQMLEEEEARDTVFFQPQHMAMTWVFYLPFVCVFSYCFFPASTWQ